jgi:transposase
VDLHRRRTVVVRIDDAGGVLSATRIDNSPEALATAVDGPGERTVVMEATGSWYWAADVAQATGAQVRLAHPLGLSWGHRRRKDDFADARDLADMARLGRLPDAYVAPPELRELRELVRHRAKLVSLRSGLKAQVHAVLAKEGVAVPMTSLFSVGGNELLDDIELAPAFAARAASLRRLIAHYDEQVAEVSKTIASALESHAGYQAIPGVGATLAAVFVAEIGDISRFSSPERLASWAGLTPRHRESDTTVVRGRITKQGSRLVRWAAVEAAMRVRADHPLMPAFTRIAERRGRKIARWRWPANFSRWCTTGSETAASAASSPRRPACEPRTWPRRRRVALRGPDTPVPERLIAPAGSRPDRFMPPSTGRRDAQQPRTRPARSHDEP